MWFFEMMTFWVFLDPTVVHLTLDILGERLANAWLTGLAQGSTGPVIHAVFK